MSANDSVASNLSYMVKTLRLSSEVRDLHLLFILQIKQKEETIMRYTGSNWKVSRRLGISILETGQELKKRPYGPGQHGNSRKKKPSEYGKQLVEKTKVTSYLWCERTSIPSFILNGRQGQKTQLPV